MNLPSPPQQPVLTLVMSSVLERTLMLRSSASLRLVSPPLYSCLSCDTAADELLPMQVAFQPE